MLPHKECVLFVLYWIFSPTVTSIKLVNNGYEDVVISIGKNVPEDPAILKRLENYFTMTSSAVFTATRNRIYFREITIVVPQTWTHRPFYVNAKDSETEHAQIIIDLQNPAYGHAPYVKQYAECGQPGLYIHLTPEYLLKDEITYRWGLPGKTLAHEWAHLRWGLFDEYPIDPQDSPFYRYNGQWHPTRCSTEVEGVLKNEKSKGGCTFDSTGKPSPTCKFFPRMKQNKAVASILFMQYLESVVEFCDDSFTSPHHLQHNNLAPNRQNRLCGYRSAWEVMKKHPDFGKGTVPLARGTNTAPKFRYAQVRPRRRVLVLDTSGSMAGTSLKILRQAASNFIMNNVETGSSLGIVEFNTAATTLSPLVKIQNRKDRETLISRLPTTATGKTSIGGGLKKAIQALRTSKSGVGGTLILITDGQENEMPWIKDIKPSLISQGVMVHALAYGQKAETDISILADETGGRTFFFSGQKQSSLVESLAAMVSQQKSELFDTPITVISDTKILYRGTPYVGKFHIDADLGRDTVVTIIHEDALDVVIRGPNNTEIILEDKTSSFDQSINGGLLRVPLPENITGEWTYEINSWKYGSMVTTSVISQPLSATENTIQINSWISQTDIIYDALSKFTIYTDVKCGNAPVLEAIVYASLEGPEPSNANINLKDNGVGSDLIKGDGIYSAYVLASDLEGNGRYNIKVSVVGYNDTTKIVSRGGRSGALAVGESDGKIAEELRPSENFERVASAGEFRVVGYPNETSSETLADVTPPSRITDFNAVLFNQDTGETILSWSAVGDDMDRGKAARYHIHVTNNVTRALLHIDHTTQILDSQILTGSLDNPKEAGQEELITVNIKPDGNETVYVVVRASDHSNNVGDVSNMVTLSYATEVAVPVEDQSTYVSYLTTVLIPVSALILLLVCTTIICVCCSNKPSNNRKVSLKKQASCHSILSFDSTDMTFMNYAQNGHYVLRCQESITSWKD